MTWPITRADLRQALQYSSTQGDDDELDLFAEAACERIDAFVGRNVEPHRHENDAGDLPRIFTLAAREAAKLWWQQTHGGPRGARTGDAADALAGVPMGAELPRKVQGWLQPYQPPAGIA